jgi:hypothetical protein
VRGPFVHGGVLVLRVRKCLMPVIRAIEGLLHVGSDAIQAKPDGRLVPRSHTCDLLLIIVHILLVGLKHGQVARMSRVLECTDD